MYLCYTVKSRDYQAALDSFGKALEMANYQNDSAAEVAIRRAIEDVNQKIVAEIKEGKNKGKDEDTEDETQNTNEKGNIKLILLVMHTIEN